MCKECEKYNRAGALYCLECGSPTEPIKEAEDKKTEPEGMFKHASLDLDLEPLD